MVPGIRLHIHACQLCIRLHDDRRAKGALPQSSCYTSQDAPPTFQAAFAAARAAAKAGHSGQPSGQVKAPNTLPAPMAGVQSVSERFAVMQQTLHRRITSGERCTHTGCSVVLARQEVGCRCALTCRARNPCVTLIPTCTVPKIGTLAWQNLGPSRSTLLVLKRRALRTILPCADTAPANASQVIYQRT